MSDTVAGDVRDDDLPGLFQAADAAATRAQGNYARLVAVDLSVMVLGAALGAVSLTVIRFAGEIALGGAICIAISFAMTFALRSEHLSGTWYRGRAVAESVKTAAWRYMTCAEPFPRELDGPAADRVFTAAMDSFVRDHRLLGGALPAGMLALPQITAGMRAARSLPLSERKRLYIGSRVADQRDWYAIKAELNRRRAAMLFGLILGCQALALVAAIALVRWPDLRLNLTGVFAAMAAALVGWTQLKKHEELASVYGLTAQELASLAGLAEHVATDEGFSELVVGAEGTIARENALWLARRQR